MFAHPAIASKMLKLISISNYKQFWQSPMIIRPEGIKTEPVCCWSSVLVQRLIRTSLTLPQFVQTKWSCFVKFESISLTPLIFGPAEAILAFIRRVVMRCMVVADIFGKLFFVSLRICALEAWPCEFIIFTTVIVCGVIRSVLFILALYNNGI